MKKNLIELQEICELNMGQSPNSSSYNEDKEGLPFFQGNADFGELYPKVRKWCTEPKKVVEGDSLLISVRAPIGALNFSTEKCCIGRGLAGITIKDNVNLKFVYYNLKYRTEELQNKGTGSTFKAINKGTLAETKIKNISYQEQIKCVEILDRINAIINYEKEELELFDSLIKSRFVEMFGDPIKNDKNWEKCSIESVCDKIYGGGTPSKSHAEYFEGDIPWVTPKDMKFDVLLDSRDHITEEAVKNSSAKMVPVDSVIMVIRSGILKHTLPIAINAVPITVNQDLKVFISGDQITTRFLAMQFKMIEKDVLASVRAVTADNIEFNVFRKREIIIPPLDLQKNFESFTNQVDKLKLEVQKSLDETQLLFNSLMQEYFE